MPTPHNNAQKGQIAKTVLMPGDPLRAKFIADTFLQDAVLVNEVRGMLAYTGTYNGATVTINKDELTVYKEDIIFQSKRIHKLQKTHFK